MWRYVIIPSCVIYMGIGTAIADTTDREHAGGGQRQDENHLAAWKTLLDEQDANSGGGLFRRSGCGVGDFNNPECARERGGDDGGDSGGGGDH